MPMKYRNVKTGHTMIFSTRIMSEEWEPVIEQVPVFSAPEMVEEKSTQDIIDIVISKLSSEEISA